MNSTSMNEDNHNGERIAKVMARSGLCSRREAEEWVAAGRVKVNGTVIDSPALNVSAQDKIMIDGKILPEKPQTRLFLYHKPAGLVTTHKDELGRDTVFDHLPEDLPRVISVGRLDLNTEGLLLLTNDGELARFLELPSTAWSRKYRVRVHGKVNEKRLESLKKGITVEGVRYGAIHATLEKREGAEKQAKGGATNSWLSIVIREGKNREIRRVMEALGLRVTRLIRTDYGPFSLGKMEPGSALEIGSDTLKHQVAKFFAQGRVVEEEDDDDDSSEQGQSSAKPRTTKKSKEGYKAMTFGPRDKFSGRKSQPRPDRFKRSDETGENGEKAAGGEGYSQPRRGRPAFDGERSGGNRDRSRSGAPSRRFGGEDRPRSGAPSRRFEGKDGQSADGSRKFPPRGRKPAGDSSSSGFKERGADGYKSRSRDKFSGGRSSPRPDRFKRSDETGENAASGEGYSQPRRGRPAFDGERSGGNRDRSRSGAPSRRFDGKKSNAAGAGKPRSPSPRGRRPSGGASGFKGKKD